MATPDGFKVAEELRDTFLSYLTSALPIGNHVSQDELGRQFYRQWSSELFAGPLVEALPTYEKVRSLSDEFGTASDREDSLFASTMNPPINWVDIEHKFPQFRRIRDAIWPFNSDEAEEELLGTSASRFWQRELYSHQWQAFTAVVRQQRNLIVATPTGSGKTECYLIPLLYKLIAEPSEMRRLPGVRAVLLYPMNALVEDQMHRLRQLLFWINLGIQSIRKCSRMITFGRYTGATPIDASDRDPQRNVSPEAMLGLGEMAFRSEMQAAPPDILVTNFTMLEYILLRGDDQQLFSVPDLFRFLVMDEVHTYTGTQGMEVALLLRRFKSFLQMRSQGKSLFQGIGTSATLPSGADAELETAKFAATLFGLGFEKQDIIRPAIKKARLSPIKSFDSEVICQSLANFAELFPAIGAQVGLGDAPIETDIPEAEWECLAARLVSRTAAPAPGANYMWKRAAEILRGSPIFDLLRNALLSEEPACMSLSDLSMKLFGQNRDSEKATMALLKIVGAAHSEGSPLLGIRFHMFVNEPASAQLCLRKGETGQWWTRLFLSHHSRCDECASYVYPVLLCRRCGFAYLEGWRRRFVPSGAFGPELLPEPDDADDEATYSRIIFRPLESNIPKEVTDQSEVHSLCLSCGRWMVAENDPNFGKIVHDCPKDSVIQVCSWERALSNGALEECVFCEQHWIPGQDVVTPPAPSVYATATVLIEELERGIERNGVDAFESKLISFSDSRQQAAQLAYRFQKTNREFTFRQVLWQAIKESPRGVRTSDLVDLLYREARDDHRLRRLFLDNETQLHNRSMLERTITTLLFRESVTAYLTLEAQGIVKLSYDSALLENVEQVLQSDRLLLGQITPEERKAFVLFLLDWNMRFRYAISPSLQGALEVEWDWLSARNIYPKSCVARNAEAIRGELSFAISTARTQNRTFNFCKRLHERLHIGRRSHDFSISDLQAILLRLWAQVLLPYIDQTRTDADRTALYNVGRNDPDGAVLKINFDSLLWSPIADDMPIYRCDACGRIATYSVAGVCPVRDCSGSLRMITGEQIDGEKFAPVRHYRRLVRHQSRRPLRVEEHTAQVSAAKRQAIEQAFRRTDDDGVDVICGSTTFELGIDLGTIHGVFMSNLPPRIANYRQRAGRAGRRVGMVPFILSYVRQRPHDQYFWNRLPEFIAGPVPIPHLSISSAEVVARHANALFIRELLRDSTQSGRRMPLEGPPVEALVNDVLSNRKIEKIATELTNVRGPLRLEFDAIFRSVSESDKPVAAAERLRLRLVTLQNTYLQLRARDGAINVLSDYGILPSYAFPLYVDELRLSREPNDRPPRADLKLQRDRRIALQEYMPGKVIAAGKNLIISKGLWNGYAEKKFRICTNRECSQMDFTENAPLECPHCGTTRSAMIAVIPRGGFFGDVVENASEQDADLVRQRGDTYFDPANEPPPEYRNYGGGLEIAVVGARVMEQSGYRPRMRQLNPRPQSDVVLELMTSSEKDLALPNLPAVPCLKKAGSADPQRRDYYLMHEFTTDIIRLRVLNNSIGQLLASAPDFERILGLNPERTRQRFYWDCFRRTLGEALIAAASRILDIDSAEIGVSFHMGNEFVSGKEFILFDTASGGAGYARQIAENIQAIFLQAEALTGECNCGDSCYRCIRSYANQPFHRRLNRFFVAAGLASFNLKNWQKLAAFSAST